MDIISHAIAGAATGYHFGKPVEGAILAIIPDIVLGVKRVYIPGTAYRITHSLLFIIALSTILYPWLGLLPLFSLMSHIVLDLPTHGKQWAPRLLWPSDMTIWYNEEWEFFNSSWRFGLLLTTIWTLFWILLP